MKKIININLSGRVIPIEDLAYEKLQAYIESLRRYFVKEEGRDEIINDIESRIAELMNEKVRKGATCVTEADIEEIIASMGRPEDFDDEPEVADTTAQAGRQQQQQQYSYKERKAKSRLYRDSGDKFIGGVCSGIAAYLNVDPTIVRILFAIITFGGFGLGFLIYILLWMILPTKDLDGYGGKRLYRNPEDKVIGGVAGGMAAYLNRETWLIRLIFAAPFIFSIFVALVGGYHWDFDFFPNIFLGSLGSTFALIYVILWMLLPEAKSQYEKMEMRGEKVDVNTIRQNVKEGMDNMKDKVKTWGEEVKESAQNFGEKAKEFANTRGKTFASEVKETARTSGRGLGHVIGVLFKAFFLFIAGTIAFAFFVALLALLFGGIAWWPVNNFLWTSQWQQVYGWGTLIFFLIVPLIAIITWVMRRVLRVRSKNSYLGWIFGGLWTLGWVSAVLLAASVSKDFREYEHTDTNIPVKKELNKMIVAVSQPELEYRGRLNWINEDAGGWDLSDDTIRLSTVRITVKVSNDTSYHVTLRKHSYGRTEEEAIGRAQHIGYDIITRDSVLDLGNGYAVGKEDKFRGQHVEIEILVPVGKKIAFDESVPSKLNPIGSKWTRRHRTTVTINGKVIRRNGYNEYAFRYATGVEYTMGLDGNLKDPDGNTIDTQYERNRNNYRYEGEDTNYIKESIEQKKRELEDLEKKMNEQKQTVPVSENESESMDDREDGVTAGSPSPAFSLFRF